MKSLRNGQFIPFLLLATLLLSPPAQSQTSRDYSYNDSYRNDDSYDRVESSPKQGWGESALADNKSTGKQPLWMDILLWVPNRILDFTDIFRIDVGVGPSVGAVVHLTEYGDFGARAMMPSSVRMGLFGRRLPVLIEKSSEYGIGPAFRSSPERKACKGQIGVGLDLLLVGANVGICLEEVADFAAGIFFFDVMNDDVK